MSEVHIDAVGRTIRVLFERAQLPIAYQDPADGARLVLDPAAAGAPDGYLPAIVVAGEAVWRETTGKGFALDIKRDPASLLGYRLRGIGAGSFATVMLASMEAVNQVTRPDAILVSEFNALWSAATERLRRDPVAQVQSRARMQP